LFGGGGQTYEASLAPARAAALLMRCGHGAAFDATSASNHQKHLGEMARAVIAGMRG